MKKFLILLLLIGITFVACDRFKHNFSTEPNNDTTTQDFFNDFKQVMQRLNANNIDTLMSFYSDDYLNNGQTKNDMQTFYNSLLDYSFNSIEITLISLNNLNISYNIKLIATRDTIFTKDISDVLKKQNDTYMFYGNQQQGQQISKQRVLVELFTGTLCQNCPYAESALEELKVQLGDKFSYVEYHHYMADPLEIPVNSQLFSYYNLSGVPKAIFQGQTILDHYHEDTAETYENTIEHYAEIDATALLDSLSYSISETELNGRIKIEFLNTDLDNLKLKAVLVEKVSDKTNFSGELCKQVVFAYSETEIIPQTGFFDFSIADLPENIPNDTQIIIWIQRIDDTYSPDTCKVYNVYEEDIH